MDKKFVNFKIRGNLIPMPTIVDEYSFGLPAITLGNKFSLEKLPTSSLDVALNAKLNPLNAQKIIIR